MRIPAGDVLARFDSDTRSIGVRAGGRACGRAGVRACVRGWVGGRARDCARARVRVFHGFLVFFGLGWPGPQKRDLNFLRHESAETLVAHPHMMQVTIISSVAANSIGRRPTRSEHHAAINPTRPAGCGKQDCSPRFWHNHGHQAKV